MIARSRPRIRLATLVFSLILLNSASSDAGWPRSRRARAVEPLAAVVSAAPSNSSGMLGTFYPTPYVNVRGNGPAGGGYSPLGQFGDSNLSINGPLSTFRTTTAPVTVYSRGFDGSYRPQVGTSISYPNYPRASRVVYPTRANVDPKIRRQATPPWWDDATNWIDLN